MSLHLDRYSTQNSILRPLIKYMWHIHGQTSLCNELLLPVSSNDIIINKASPISYTTEYSTITFSKEIHCTGKSKNFWKITQNGLIDLWGISFNPYGHYPFLKRSTPLSQPLLLSDIMPQLANNLYACIEPQILNRLFAKRIERVLLKSISEELYPDKGRTKLFNLYERECSYTLINSFCRKAGINKRTFERLCHQYIGLTPAKWKKIRRLNNMIHNMISLAASSLTSIVYDSNYYDQSHAIRDCRRLTGYTPNTLHNHSKSIKQKLQYTPLFQ